MSLEAFSEYLTELGDESQALALSKLSRLSSLSAEDLPLFLQAWSGMGEGRRREITSQMVNLAEEEPELNFDDIFIACLQDPDGTVRECAIDGLWEYECRSLIHPLITMMRQDGQEAVRAAAAMALGRFVLLADLGKLRPGDNEKLEQALTAMISDPGEPLEVRRRAVEAIAPFSLPRIAEIIREAYDSDESLMRVSAIYAMGISNDLAWVSTLLEELGSIDSEMRFEAAGACGELGEEGAVPYLIELIEDEDSQVAICAITALGKIGGEEAEDTLRECLNHLQEYIRDAAADALEQLSYDKDPFSFDIE